MFSSQSPFRPQGQSPYGQPQQQQQQPNSPFAQQQQSSSSASYPFNNSTPGNNNPSYSGNPTFANSGAWGSTASPQGYGAGAGQQFGASTGAFGQSGGPGQQQGFGAGAQGNSQGGGGTPGFGEKAKRSYLPGYLSNGAMKQSEATPPQNNGDDSKSWDSPVRRTSVSGSPASRFGGQSLFGARDGTPSRSPKNSSFYGREPLGRSGPGGGMFPSDMDEDAPPISSLGDNNDNGMSLQPETFSHAPSTSPDPHPPAFNSASNPTQHPIEGYSVHIFGFPSSALDHVLDYFSQFGEIVSKTPSTEGGNWVTVSYAQAWSASRAARKNGEVLGGVLMVGVKIVDEDAVRRGMAGAEGSSTPVDASEIAASRAAATSTPVAGGSGIGKPINVFGPGSAFKTAAPTPPRRGFLGLGGGATEPATSGGAATKTVDPHASLFAEKSRQAVMLQQWQEQKSVLGKVSDAIFGW